MQTSEYPSMGYVWLKTKFIGQVKHVVGFRQSLQDEGHCAHEDVPESQ